MDQLELTFKRPLSGAFSHAVPSTVTALRVEDRRKGSLPEIRPLRAAHEQLNGGSNDIHEQSARPSTAHGQPVENRSDSITAILSLKVPNDASACGELEHDVESPILGLSSHFPPPSGFLQDHRSRSRPDLRIAVGVDDRRIDKSNLLLAKSLQRGQERSASETQQQVASAMLNPQ